MPRPVKDDPRDHFRTFRFTEAEVTRLEARAKAQGQTLSAFARERLLGSPAIGNAATEVTVRPATSKSRDHALQTVAQQMRKVGTNLNQIARRMNEQRISPPWELTFVLDEIRVLVRQAREP